MVNGIEGNGKFGKMVFAHPAGGEGNERKGEQQAHIGPDNFWSNMAHSMQEMMMVAPVNSHHQKAQHIADENGSELKQGLNRCLVRYFYFQYHDGDNNGYYSIAESFKAGFIHGISGYLKGRKITLLNT